MNKSETPEKGIPEELRRRAEKILEMDASQLKSMPVENFQNLLQELHVHQIELELQNEELRRAQRELEASRLKYYELYEFAPIGYFTFDQQKIIREVNLAGAELLGVERSYLIGAPFGNYVNEEYLKEFFRHIRDVFSSRSKLSCEVKLVKRDDKQFFAIIQSIPLWDQDGKFTRCLSAVRDIDERKRAQFNLNESHHKLEEKVQARTAELSDLNEALQTEIAERKQFETILRASEENYRGLVESSPDGILVEQNKSIVYMNPAALQLLGYDSAVELEGVALSELFHEESKPSVVRHLKQMRKLDGSVLDEVMLCKDKRPVDVEASFIRTTYREKPGILALIRDVSEKKSLQKINRRMERLASLGEVSSSIAHEIRNPLGVIQLNCSYLSNRLNIPDKLQARLRDIEQSINRIEDIMDTITGLTRPKNPKLIPVDVHEILDSSLKVIVNDLKKLRIKTRRIYKAECTKVRADINQLVQVFINLFSNARDAMVSGGRLTIKTLSDEADIEVEVTDTGPGIADEYLDKIFEPFFTTKKKGTGLGMSIVERIVREHGGRISVESKDSEGVTFRIRLPLARS